MEERKEDTDSANDVLSGTYQETGFDTGKKEFPR